MKCNHSYLERDNAVFRDGACSICLAVDNAALRKQNELLQNIIAETNAWFVENGHEGTPPQRKLIDLLLEAQ